MNDSQAVAGPLDPPVGRPVPKRCEPCRATGAIHCADPENCGGPWDKRHDEAQRRREKERLMGGIL